eukprot:2178536-Prymnesium_polylepis.1
MERKKKTSGSTIARARHARVWSPETRHQTPQRPFSRQHAVGDTGFLTLDGDPRRVAQMLHDHAIAAVRIPDRNAYRQALECAQVLLGED